jgi:hypothetical protein
MMPNGNGKTAAIVLSIVLGAATIAATTTSIIGWSQAKKADRLDQEIKDWKKTEFGPFKSDFDTLKGQILSELKNLSEGQQDLKKLLQDYMLAHR